MFVSTEVITCLKTLLGWNNHYDLVEIPALDPALNTSDSGQFYQSFHPALRLDIIRATIPVNRTLNEYLETKVKDGITQLLNDVIKSRKYGEYAKQILGNDPLLDRYGWSPDTITNEGRFVGFMIKVNLEIGLEIAIKSLGFQFNQAQVTPFNVYVFHSSKNDPVVTIPVTTTQGTEWQWQTQENLKLYAEKENIMGGAWVIGYYQDDITGQAINFTDFDWRVGPCGTCDGNAGRRRQDHWRSVNRFLSIAPFYVPPGSYGVKGKMFDLTACLFDYTKSWGLNFRFNAECDLSYFFCQNKDGFKTALGLQVARMILEDMKFSQEVNYIEENLKHMIIRDLEGDVETYGVNLPSRIDKAIKAINFDHSKLSASCLPCNSNRGPFIGVA